MNWVREIQASFRPPLRKTLREINPEASIVYPHVRALRTVYTRPALDAVGAQIFTHRKERLRWPLIPCARRLSPRRQRLWLLKREERAGWLVSGPVEPCSQFEAHFKDFETAE